MPSPASRPTSLTSPSPSRPPESPTEILYNTAVQSFVRRDHLKTHATLSRLISTLKKRSRLAPRRKWYDFGSGPHSAPTPSAESIEIDEWLVKTLKLYISAHASLYSDPPDPSILAASIDPNLVKLIPPNPPNHILYHVHRTCLECFNAGILPPPLVSTLILASLKLRPADMALSASHRIAEDWLAALPDSFFQNVSPGGGEAAKTSGPEERKRVEAAREGYLKVIELFIGEVLAREGEWEMARGILDGENILGSKRKEVLYRHLRSLQSRREAPRSASSSGILPSPTSSGFLPTPESSPAPEERTRKGKSRSDSTSTSSSERTARPGGTGLAITKSGKPTTQGSVDGTVKENTSRAKGKARTTESTDSGSGSLPSRFELNHPYPLRSSGGAAPYRGSRLESVLNTTLAILPSSLRDRLTGLTTSQLLGVAIPLPLIAIVLILVSLRRRIRRRQAALGNLVDTGIGAGGTVAAAAANQAVDQVRARLRQVRERNGWQWIVWWVRWWVERFQGIWRLGTTITYF